MSKFKVGDNVVVSKLMLNTRNAGINIGDIGIVYKTWNDGYMGKSGALVQLDWFLEDDHLPLTLRNDSEFDIETYTYQFFNDELELIKEV